MSGWLLRFILVMIVIRVLWRMLNGMIEGAAGPRPRRGSAPSDQSVPLVRDPVCGTYIVRTRALTSGQGEAMQFFCSERCRSEYRARH